VNVKETTEEEIAVIKMGADWERTLNFFCYVMEEYSWNFSGKEKERKIRKSLGIMAE